MVRICLGFVLLTLLAATPARAFEGEQIVQAAGFPALTKFIAGDPERPLVVFIPGAHHTARIAYGGHAGGREQDFLAYWLVRQGYNFLGISYPIATKNEIMEDAFPDFTARDWGRQAAEIAKQTVEQHHLTNRIIVIGWSMGGRVAEPVSEYAKAEGLDLLFFVAAAATPGVTGLIEMNASLKMTAEGYADRTGTYRNWMRQIAHQGKANGHPIIDEQSYVADYVGDIPVNLEGYGLHYREAKFVRDHWADEQEFRVYEFGKLPTIAVMMPSEPLDPRHALTDRGTWGLLIVNKLWAEVDAAKLDWPKLPRERWQELVDLTRNAPDLLSVAMPGNHFFFLGEAGARDTARAIHTLETRVAEFKQQLARLLESKGD
jgi:pimeloyl-ACP methyl ester carboxylesterase